MKTVISEKGQVTIPKALRAKLGLRPGTVIDFAAERGRLIGRKAMGTSPADEVWGILDLGEPVDGFIERVRGR